LFPAAAGSRGETAATASENESEKTAAVPSTAPKRAKKGYGNNSKDELRISCWHARDGGMVGWLGRLVVWGMTGW